MKNFKKTFKKKIVDCLDFENLEVDKCPGIITNIR